MGNSDDLWDRGDIARALGVSVKAVDKWRDDDTFPLPAYRFSGGPVWEAYAVRRWRKDKMTERRLRRRER